MGAFELALQELAKNSPYALIIIALSFIFSHSNDKSNKNMKELYENAIGAIQSSCQKTLEENRKSMEAWKDILTKNSSAK